MRLLFPVCSFLLVNLGALFSSAAAEDPARTEAPGMREISPGIFQLGDIRIDRARRTVSFPGKLNMDAGLLEYLLVTASGPTHETLLTSEVQPADVHLAMLLLGAKGAGITTPAPEDAPPAQLNKEYLARAPKLKGDPISITVSWQAGAERKSAPVEDWLMHPETRKPAARGPWIYTGSMFREDRFLAQSDGTFAALVTYPAALINNPRSGNDNDAAWAVNEKAVPAKNTAIEIILQLAASAPAEEKPSSTP